MLWLDRGKVSAAYPWQTIQGMHSVTTRMGRGRRGATPTEWWLDFTDGSQELIDPPVHGIVEAGLLHYRISHGLPDTQAYWHPGEKRRVRPRYTMRGRGRWTWSGVGCVLLLLFPILVNGLFLLLYWLAHP